MYVTQLTPIPRQQKSFYGKAILIQEGELTLLKSYDTIVAQYDAGSKKLTISDFYSNTTTRHIKAFVYLITGEILTTKEIKKRYYTEVN
jgi:hypothetical protein